MTDTGPGDDHDPTVVMCFLDVLSSGLGASILLFLIFSVLPHFGDAGGSARGKGADGAAAAGPGDGDPLDPLARNAIVVFQVTVRHPDAPVDGRRGEWAGLPPLRPGAVFTGTEKVAARPGELLFHATCLQGFGTDRKATFLYRPAAGRPFTVDAVATVGGLVQRKSVAFTPLPGGGWGRAVTRHEFPWPPPPVPNLEAKPDRPPEVLRFDLANAAKPPAAGPKAKGPRKDWIVLP